MKLFLIFLILVVYLSSGELMIFPMIPIPDNYVHEYITDFETNSTNFFIIGSKNLTKNEIIVDPDSSRFIILNEDNSTRFEIFINPIF